jgi:nucleotidyltransferase/DNA polymerase involved in DNA repair
MGRNVGSCWPETGASQPNLWECGRFPVLGNTRRIFAEFTPIVEPLSLDEAYLDVTTNLPGIASATEIAERIRAKIWGETGLTASAGVSYNKFLAKLASDHRKPNGLFVITPKMGQSFVESLPVEQFHGVGPATAAKMHRLGIESGHDLKAQPLTVLQRHFGKSGAFSIGSGAVSMNGQCVPTISVNPLEPRIPSRMI